MTRFGLRPLLAVLGLIAALAFVASEADARIGGGRSFGSRGARTFSAPPMTQTAPTARPMQRTLTQPGQPSAARTAAASGQARPGLFSRPGLLGGLAAGFLGAGLFGLLFGNGLFGGLAGFASILGLLLQIAMVAGVGWLAWNWWQRRTQPQPAFAGPGGLRADLTPMTEPGGSLPPRQAVPPAVPSDEIGLVAADYDAFEQLLGEIQTAYSAEDMNALRERCTPEMYGYLAEELGENVSRGVIAALSDVKLLQGDLAEAWREGNVEYATVAMRYQIVDQLLDRRTRAPVDGEAEPIEVTELWTFMRARGGKWLLSAIQQPEDEV